MNISRTLLSGLILLVLSVASFAQSQTYTSPEGRFSIDLPKEKVAIESVASVVGGVEADKIYGWQLVDETIAFNVSTIDLPDLKTGEEKVKLTGIGDRLTKRVTESGGRIVSRREVALGSYPGVEVRYVQKVEGFDMTYISTYYLAGKRLYFLMGLWMTPEKEQRVIKVMSTFNILNPPAEQKEKSQ